MNQQEHLLTILGEEGGEVAQAVAKALRFGMEDKNVLKPDGPDNMARILEELDDLNATVSLCRKLGILPYPDFDQGARERAKRLKISQFMAYAYSLGHLDRAPTIDGKAPICHRCANGHRLKATATALGAIYWRCDVCEHSETIEEIPTLVKSYQVNP